MLNASLSYSYVFCCIAYCQGLAVGICGVDMPVIACGGNGGGRPPPEILHCNWLGYPRQRDPLPMPFPHPLLRACGRQGVSPQSVQGLRPPHWPATGGGDANGPTDETGEETSCAATAPVLSAALAQEETPGRPIHPRGRSPKSDQRASGEGGRKGEAKGDNFASQVQVTRYYFIP